MTPQEAMSLSPEERKDLMRDLFFHGGSEGKKLARQIQKEDEKQKIRDKNEEYKTLIKTQGIHPLRIPTDAYRAIKDVLKEAVKYAPEGGLVQVRVSNYHEPFTHPALRLEVMGVTPNGAVNVLCRYEYGKAPIEFSNEIFDEGAVFTYVEDKYNEVVEPWVATHLSSITLMEEDRYGSRDTKKILRKEGLYLMIPTF
jgi:hypothetical protein